jgi:hemerythrin-like domain-containing protein
MCDGVLNRLRDDHKRFERFFKAIEHECSKAEADGHFDHPRLLAIACYLGEQALPCHHALEDAMFFNIVKLEPRFRTDVYDLPEDHESSKREFQLFEKSVNAADGRFSEAARSFVANERGHFISEEEVLFPFAAKTLTQKQWNDLSVSLAILEQENHPAPSSAPIKDLLTPLSA